LSQDTVEKFEAMLSTPPNKSVPRDKFIVHLIPMPAYKQQLFASSWKFVEEKLLPWLHAHNIPVIDDRYSFPDSSSYSDNYHLGPRENQQLVQKFAAEVDAIVDANEWGYGGHRL
jgi:hypothetical protein